MTDRVADTPLELGTIRLRNRVLLAPMAGVSDLPLRELAWSFGAGCVAAEMVTDRPDLWHSRKSSLRREAVPGATPHVMQIAGHDPNTMAAAARRLVATGADVIDLNFGCPMKKVCRKLAGSALLADEPLVERLVRAVIEAVDVPVTVKMRTGPAPELRNAPQLARRLEAAGVAALTLHGRTRVCRFNGQAEYDTIAAVKAAVRIPVIANGDIDSVAKARTVLRATGADGIMIGRAALGAPWLPGLIARALAEPGGAHTVPDTQACLRVAERHLVRLHEFYGAEQGLRIARKHLSWYLEKLPVTLQSAFEAGIDLKERRAQFNRLTDPTAQLDWVAELETDFAGRIAA